MQRNVNIQYDKTFLKCNRTEIYKIIFTHSDSSITRILISYYRSIHVHRYIFV